MDVLGVILARGGSVGLPRKHLLPLRGKPVIGYTFAHAKAARHLRKCVVSSDSLEVLQLARDEGFATIRRPDHLATSEASVQDVMLHALDEVERDGTFYAKAIVVLYGNVPVRGDGVIDQAIQMLFDTGCDSVRSFTPVGKWHPNWMASLDNRTGKVDPLHSGSIHRRQDLTPLFLHDGAVVAVSRGSMLRGRVTPEDPHAFFGVDRRGFETGHGQTVEIDHLHDLHFAEAILRERSERNAGENNEN